MKLAFSSLRPSPSSGFTLVELLLVLVILGVLAALVVPKFTNKSEKARVTAAHTDISSLEVALDSFEIEVGRFPNSEEGLRALVEPVASATNWGGPYIKRGMPMDPWGRPYVYRFPGQHNPTSYDLYSLGPDGREGTDDIDNWTSTR